ncbi:hypothetical protein MMC13_006426 [Lambiella insularis]|nr:hypothetical protein [Lambiella insularis]
MRTGGVAQSYLDPLAVRIQSIRTGARGRGWRRFLVFAELTKSKKGSEYVALFTYFSFEAWLRIIFAEGPRNAINAMTLYSVMQANLIPVGNHATSNGHNAVTQFFYNVMVLADSSGVEAAVLFGMLFTLIIWVISAISLAVACIFYVMFLWHHIPSQDGSLRKYCKRKIDRRLQKVVSVKVNKALAKDDMANSRADTKAGRTGDRPLVLKRQPTLPMLETGSDDKLPQMPTLSRQDTQTTLPPYTSRPPTRNESSAPGLPRQPTVPDISSGFARPAAPSRSNTQQSAMSNASYGSNAPLMGTANPMGYGPNQDYPRDKLSRMGSDHSTFSRRPLMSRSGTSSTQASSRTYQSAWRQPGTQDGGRPGPPTRQNTAFSDDHSYGRSSPASPSRQNTGTSNYQTRGGSTPGLSPIDSFGRHTPTSSTHPPPFLSYDPRSHPLPSHITHPPPTARFVAYNPTFFPPSSQPVPLVSSPTAQSFTTSPTHRNFSAPLRSARQPDSFTRQPLPPQRSGTAPLPQAAAYDDSIFDSYGAESEAPRPQVPARAATTGPEGGRWDGQSRYRPGAY